MRIHTRSISLLALAALCCSSGCSGEPELVGLWKTEKIRVTPRGRTNIIETYRTVEFLKDGSFKMRSGITTDGEKLPTIVFTGTYALIDANHVRLAVASNQARPSDKVQLTVKFMIVGDELEMGELTSSVIPETQKYRKAKP